MFLSRAVTRRAPAAYARWVLVLLACARPAHGADVLDALRGTWGLPPQDGKLGLSGSYFTVQRDETGAIRTTLDLNPGDWSCSSREGIEVAWNGRAERFEWTERSSAGASMACSLQATPRAGRLDLSVACPYRCTGDEPARAIVLERIADDRLVPPEHVVDTFCSSHDSLRQDFCRPSAGLQALIAEGNRRERQRGVLADGNDGVPLLPETERELLAILDSCRAGGRPCLVQALTKRRDVAEAAVAARQKLLADESRVSAAAVRSLTDAEAQLWAGTWNLVSDELVATLTTQSCTARGCALELSAQTNYTFGYSERHGSCALAARSLALVGTDRGFAYVEPGERERDADGAGPFANFCRLDLTRTQGGVRVALRGAGCMNGCTDAQWPGLAGEYQSRPEPSFKCPVATYGLAWDEENVCLDPELAAFDRELAAAFAAARASSRGAASAALVRAQRAWLAKRGDDCNVDKRRTCLVEAYRQRLRELTGAER